MSLDIFIPEESFISGANVKNDAKQGPSVVKITQKRRTKPMAVATLLLSVDQSRKGCGSMVVCPRSTD